jgi:hypothetical protein
MVGKPGASWAFSMMATDSSHPISALPVDSPRNRSQDTNTDVSLLLKRFSCDEHRRHAYSDTASSSEENKNGGPARENTSMGMNGVEGLPGIWSCSATPRLMRTDRNQVATMFSTANNNYSFRHT